MFFLTFYAHNIWIHYSDWCPNLGSSLCRHVCVTNG